MYNVNYLRYSPYVKADCDSIVEHQSEVDEVVTSAQELSKLTEDLRVHEEEGQARDLTDRYNALRHHSEVNCDVRVRLNRVHYLYDGSRYLLPCAIFPYNKYG